MNCLLSAAVLLKRHIARIVIVFLSIVYKHFNCCVRFYIPTFLLPSTYMQLDVCGAQTANVSHCIILPAVPFRRARNSPQFHVSSSVTHYRVDVPACLNIQLNENLASFQFEVACEHF